MAKAFKRRIRMIQAVQLEAALYKDAEIATFLKMTPAGLAQMKLDPEYDALRMQVQSGVATEAEENFLKDDEYKHERIRSMIPLALTNLYDLARSQNEAIKLKATEQILDREGTLAKVSRIGLTTEEQGSNATPIDNEIAATLLNIVKIQEERAKKMAEGAGNVVVPGNDTVQ